MGLSEIDLDVTKPHRPGILEFAEEISKVKGVDSVEIMVTDIDMEIERVKIIIRGKNLEYSQIKKAVEEIGGVIQSVDRVIFEK